MRFTYINILHTKLLLEIFIYTYICMYMCHAGKLWLWLQLDIQRI